MNDVLVRGVWTAQQLAEVASALGRVGIGLEGGGTWEGVAHYLVEDGTGAREVLVAAGYADVEVRPAVLVPLEADRPGALGRLMTDLAASGEDLVAQYSDHQNRKVLVMRETLAATSRLR
ncbi:hypothetical protein [Ruania albidiflava]|uniref:hypothetical protein n=1 Tax=Ruania albidiflava TaxID=366586 RepID=UPI0023EFDD9C|nr:hypothetical protein [Ruania albidiflava]